MRICAIICEFNPFHNGHAHLIEQAKQKTGCDAVLCIMSGNFTQRGELCVLNKFTRAKHAILSGADCVLELPAPFAVAPAEIFARGAIKLLSSIPEVTTLAFGCENADKDKFINSAKILNGESNLFERYLKEKLREGESYIKSYGFAFKNCGGDDNFISTPNNILGVEYCKAILKRGVDIDILPIKRIGAGYNDENLKNNFSSASAIRNNINNEVIKNNVPKYVYDDLIVAKNLKNEYNELCLFALLQAEKEQISSVFGCSEGLENKLKNKIYTSYEDLISKVTAKRYTASRIKRILCANLLKLNEKDCRLFLQSELYLKPLALKKERHNEILAALSKSNYPTIILKKNLNGLNKTALKCFNACEFADEIWDFIFKTSTYNYTFLQI